MIMILWSTFAGLIIIYAFVVTQLQAHVFNIHKTYPLKNPKSHKILTCLVSLSIWVIFLAKVFDHVFFKKSKKLHEKPISSPDFGSNGLEMGLWHDFM